ncbi:NPC1 (Niemann-Pick disease, type C1, gene)-like 1 [Rattus norvegicus]|uniref:NPC1-like intracellular cholesterol transporter 1 n=2 Tax=Rattus norvegicus TaxID=10116 RepID=NPCL1_RAT|nr:NPC1-like intracellular cholesterol transporter 1 precursor [Rattus norvegicus]Q6T3U3.1 RecName: Full=NPC1-like intracellular cholesterol transporter 1; Short=Npc1l1; AltName: Full=Niemann-Pick C1-like protein 1; Flags: Precursor [Rattus norvegicus]AAR97888.1 Niemann-Pick C1-like 1 [Rattus norvegicus]EDM00336.1 NPC1 (Niemann-Pick disease, type C1, gene)-like 1 [Rattus norvegicus]|eukprot:NP_001002025.1 Niemann-Pick C1-like protein 1 precursor [Rattus norvegicus]
MAAAWLGWLLWALLLSAAQGELYTPKHEAGVCTFYEECGKNPELSGGLTSLSNVSCLSNTPARHVTGEHLALLQRICPRLYNGPNTTFACCSTKQLLSLESSMSITKALLTRCPACSDNFVSLHCHNTCSPDQSLFINVTRVVERGAGEPPAVVAYEAFYQRSFAEKAYESCSQVRIPAAASLAVGSMCGVYGSALCNAQRWLNFQGDTGNGLAPLDITFHLLEPGQALPDGIQPLNGKIAPCNESQGDDSAVCSCQDCAASCPVIPPPEALRPSFYMGRMPGWLALIIIFTAVFVLLSAVLVRLRVVSNRNKNKAEGPQEAPKLPHKHKLSPHTILGRFFQNWGTRVASWPLTVLALSFIVVIALAAGLTFIELTTDPVELWSAPKSQARKEKSFHDEHFGPFFRTNQIFVTARNRSSYKYDSLLLGSKNFSGILSLDFLLELLELQERLRHLQVWSPEAERNISLQDICYAPLNPYNTSLSDCCVNSLLQYFQNNRTLLMLTANQTLNGQTSLVDWKDHFLYCANAPLTFKDGTSLALSCMADYGAPVFPFLAVGGYQGTDYSEAEALIITFSLNNYPADDPRMAQAKLWEEAFLKEMESFQRNTSDKFQVAFSAERSLEDEINRTTIQDLPVFAVSYIIVFLYISLALGSYSRCSRVAVESKATLGLGGVIVVLGAVLAAMGFYSYLGVPSSLVIIQVVPFLVLAVGADNIFIFVLEYQRLPRMPGEQREAHIGRTLGSVAPSMLLCSLSEAICFFLGALTPMPAVRTFALTSGLAIILDFLLQMTAFVALLSLDSKRQEASRPDVLCCFSTRKLPPPKEKEGLLLRFFRKIYAPFLLHRFIRPVVMLLFLTLFGANLYLMCNINVGLDQELALPKDSYLIDYFLFLNRYLEVGPPVYFVTTSGFNFSSEAGMNATCSSAGCKSFSLTQKIQYASEFPDQSYVAIAASSWVDDFIDWLTPSSSCCRLYIRGPHKDEFCPSTDTSFNCLKNCMNRTLGPVRPTAEQFHKYLPWFLNDPPNIRCPKGGLAAYRTSVNLSSDGQVIASQFMAYHKPLRNSQDFTEALRASRLLAANITADLRKVPGTDPNFEVFPYTISNVFYQQYLTVLPEGIFTLALCFVPTFVVCYLLLGLDMCSGILNLLSIIMILVDTIGLMAVWGISYNAVSLINLVTAVGMSVEFVSHITRSFAVSTKPTRLERAKDATVFMGSAVFAGVAMTNFPGILILGFAQAQLIQIFFFRLNLLITLLGLLHGLVFLPVVLSYLGPDVNQALVQEEKLASEAAVAPEPSCPQYPSPADADANVNYGFAPELAHGANAARSSLPKSDQKF